MTFRAILTASALIAIGMMTGRLLGLLREVMMASQFGTGAHADMAIALIILPDFIALSLMGNAAAAALVPAFAARDHARALALFWQALMVSMLGFIAVALLVAWQGDEIVALLSGGTELPQARQALLVTLSTLPLAAGTGVVTAWLQYRGRFFVPAFASALFNTVILLTLWLAPTGLMVLALGILTASLLRLLAHLGAFVRSGGGITVRMFSTWELGKGLLRTYAATTGTGLLGLLPHYVPYVVVVVSASGLALFSYAFKLVAFPAAFGQTIVQLVLLPWFVNQRRTASDGQALADSYRLALRAAWIFSFSLALALWLCSRQVAALCFSYGEMTPEDVAHIGELMEIGIWAVPGMLLTTVWQQVLYAHERPRPALMASMVQAVLLVPLMWLGHHYYQHGGVMGAYVVVQAVPLAALAWLGSRHVGMRFGMPHADYWIITLAIAAAFIPLAWLFMALALSPAAALVLAIAIGMLLLAAGTMACPSTRHYVMQWWRRHR